MARMGLRVLFWLALAGALLLPSVSGAASLVPAAWIVAGASLLSLIVWRYVAAARLPKGDGRRPAVG